jgi:hypothetical protein
VATVFVVERAFAVAFVATASVATASAEVGAGGVVTGAGADGVGEDEVGVGEERIGIGTIGAGVSAGDGVGPIRIGLDTAIRTDIGATPGGRRPITVLLLMIPTTIPTTILTTDLTTTLHLLTGIGLSRLATT